MGDGMKSEVIDEGFFRRYRELLDAEDVAFDELEHAYEEGDRATYDADLAAWRSRPRTPHGLPRAPPSHARHDRLSTSST